MLKTHLKNWNLESNEGRTRNLLHSEIKRWSIVTLIPKSKSQELLKGLGKSWSEVKKLIWSQVRVKVEFEIVPQSKNRVVLKYKFWELLRSRGLIASQMFKNAFAIKRWSRNTDFGVQLVWKFSFSSTLSSSINVIFVKVYLVKC